jgi:hypothetical protein
MWVYGAAVCRSLSPPFTSSGGDGAVRIDALAGRPRSPRHLALRQRASRVRNAGVALIVFGAAAIAIVAPSSGDPGELHGSFGEDPRHASVLIAMVAAAIGVGIVSAFTTALLRPPSADDKRPFSAPRATVAMAIALAGAATYYVLRAA